MRRLLKIIRNLVLLIIAGIVIVAGVLAYNVSKSGATRIQDFTAEIGRTFGEGGRLTIRAGGFYRRMNFQDQFYILDHLHDRGVLGSLNIKIDARTRAYARYDLDTDFFLFAPQIKHAQVFRLGLAWRY